MKAERLVEQFANLPFGDSRRSQKFCKSQENFDKNRWPEWEPYDETLVQVKDVSYINASHIRMPITSSISHDWISTQAPLENTIEHFWKMVWQEKSETILMLTKLGSGNQNWKTQLSVEIDPDQPTLVNSAGQATQYWPSSGEEMKFTDGMILSNQSEKLLRGYKVTKLNLIKDGTTRSIRHIHFLNWPDMSVPDVDGELFHLVDQIVNEIPKENPMIIHCSAGVGRAGTTIALAAAIEQMRKNVEVKPLELVKTLRYQRFGMVENTAQFEFLTDSIDFYKSRQSENS